MGRSALTSSFASHSGPPPRAGPAFSAAAAVAVAAAEEFKVRPARRPPPRAAPAPPTPRVHASLFTVTEIAGRERQLRAGLQLAPVRL